MPRRVSHATSQVDGLQGHRLRLAKVGSTKPDKKQQQNITPNVLQLSPSIVVIEPDNESLSEREIAAKRSVPSNYYTVYCTEL